MSKVVAGVVGAVAGFIVAGPLGAFIGFQAGEAIASLPSLLKGKPKSSTAQKDRTRVSFTLDEPRKIVIGHTALGTDLRYQEPWGASQEYLSQVFVVAGHWVEAIDEIWFNGQLAWSATGGVTTPFAGYLWVATAAQATSASVYTPGGWSNRWGANATFTGCATVYLQYRVLGVDNKTTSPFTSSVPSSVVIRGRAARLYDPRQDSSVGGSGPMRVADQSTWTFTTGSLEIGRNPALALLFYLLGWRIKNPVTGALKLSVGLGLPVDRIDLASFMTAANLCDEPVLRADGTSEPRYRCDGMFSEADDPPQVIKALEGCMNAKLRDSAGRFALQVLHNDLATPVLDFTDDDVLDDFTWDAGAALNEQKNVVLGRYTDPSDASLYQLVDCPAQRIPSLDGIDRIDKVDQALVQSPSQKQRLDKQRLQRYQFPGQFSANFGARGWAVKDGDVVRLTFAALGFTRKLFRVDRSVVQVTGVVPLTLIEEADPIYAWDREEAPAIVAMPPLLFDPSKTPVLQAITAATARGAYVAGVKTPAAPFTSNDNSITITGFSATLDGGLGVMDFPAGSITGLSPGLSYGVFRSILADQRNFEANEDGSAELNEDGTPMVSEADTGGFYFAAKEGIDALNAMASSNNMFIGWQATSNGGSYPAPQPLPAGYGGAQSSPRYEANTQIQ